MNQQNQMKNSPIPKNTPTLPPIDLVNRKHVLTPMEAAYCLNVSRDRIYKWIQNGTLITLNQRPLRIKSSCVREMMDDFDE